MWPFVYLILVMAVSTALVMARFLAPWLLSYLPPALIGPLSRQVDIELTSDRITFDLFDHDLLSRLNNLLFVSLLGDLLRLPEGERINSPLLETRILRKLLVPIQYWSGCPPPQALLLIAA